MNWFYSLFLFAVNTHSVQLVSWLIYLLAFINITQNSSGWVESRANFCCCFHIKWFAFFFSSDSQRSERECEWFVLNWPLPKNLSQSNRIVFRKGTEIHMVLIQVSGARIPKHCAIIWYFEFVSSNHFDYLFYLI